MGRPHPPEHHANNGGWNSRGPVNPQLVRHLQASVVAEVEEGCAKKSLFLDQKSNVLGRQGDLDTYRDEDGWQEDHTEERDRLYESVVLES